MRRSAGFSDDVHRSQEYRRDRERGRTGDVVAKLAPVAKSVNEENADWRKGLVKRIRQHGGERAGKGGVT